MTNDKYLVYFIKDQTDKVLYFNKVPTTKLIIYDIEEYCPRPFKNNYTISYTPFYIQEDLIKSFMSSLQEIYNTPNPKPYQEIEIKTPFITIPPPKPIIKEVIKPVRIQKHKQINFKLIFKNVLIQLKKKIKRIPPIILFNNDRKDYDRQRLTKFKKCIYCRNSYNIMYINKHKKRVHLNTDYRKYFNRVLKELKKTLKPIQSIILRNKYFQNYYYKNRNRYNKVYNPEKRKEYNEKRRQIFKECSYCYNSFNLTYINKHIKQVHLQKLK